jgi:hypothetical protein
MKLPVGVITLKLFSFVTDTPNADGLTDKTFGYVYIYKQTDRKADIQIDGRTDKWTRVQLDVPEDKHFFMSNLKSFQFHENVYAPQHSA